MSLNRFGNRAEGMALRLDRISRCHSRSPEEESIFSRPSLRPMPSALPLSKASSSLSPR